MSIPTPVSYFSGSEENKLLDISIDPQDIADKLSKLKSDKAAGDDNMAPRFLKEVSHEIAMPVALIFRKSLDILDKSHKIGEMRILLHCSSTATDLKLTIIGL